MADDGARTVKGALAFSVLDQGILSALSLLIGLLLIRLGTPEALGRFALAMAVFFMLFSVKYALVILPISTRVFGAAAVEQIAVLRVVGTFDLMLIAASTLVAALTLIAFGFDALRLAAAAAMVAAGLWRELARSVHIALGRMRDCLRMDAAASALTVAAIALLWPILPPEAACLCGLAIGNAIAGTLLGPRLHLAPRQASEMLTAYGAYLPLTRWSFVVGVTNELQSRGYVFIVQVLRGVAANGALQASRIVVSPVELLGIAWTRVTVPRLAALVRSGAVKEAYALTRFNVALMTAFALAYSAALYLAWSIIEPRLFGDQYPGIGEAVAAWCAFSVAAAQLRPLDWLFQAMERYREMAMLGIANTAAVLSFMTVLAWPVPLFATAIILAVGQLVAAAALWWLLLAPGMAPREAAP